MFQMASKCIGSDFSLIEGNRGKRDKEGMDGLNVLELNKFECSMFRYKEVRSERNVPPLTFHVI